MLIFKSTHKLLVISVILLIAIHAFNTIFLSIIISQVISAAQTNSMETFVKYFLIGMFGFLFFMLVGILNAKLKSKAINFQNTEIKKTVIDHIIKTSSYSDDVKVNLSTLTNDLKQLETKGIQAEYNLINLFFTFTFALATSFLYDVWMSLAFLFGTLLATLVAQLFKNKIKDYASNWQIANSIYTNKIKEYLLGLETVKTYQVESVVINDAVNKAQAMEEQLEKMNYSVDSTNQIIYVAVMILTFLIPFGVGIVRVINLDLSIGLFTAAVYLSNSLRSPALQSSQIINEYATTKPIRRFYTDILKLEITNRKQTNIEPFDSIEIIDANLAFDNKVVFKNANFSIDKGDKILVLGPSGVGKSTLLRLIMRAIELNDGTYHYNGKSTNKDLTNLFSLIRQQPLIFDESILYNITLGQDYNESEVLEACTVASLDEVILEKGINYIVGENGKNLSVGEIQRLEIARALIRNRSIILADEMTSALDNAKAGKIRNNLLNSSVTLIEVAHNVKDEDIKKYNKVWQL